MTKVLVAVASVVAFAQAGVVNLPLDAEWRSVIVFILGMLSAGLVSYLGGAKASSPS